MIAARHAMHARLPLAFMILGVVAFLIAALWLVMEPSLIVNYHYGMHAVALTHLIVLGFVLSVVIGSLYQLSAVVFESELYSHKLSIWHAVLHFPSVAGMVSSFYKWDMIGVGHWGSLLAVGVGFLIVNTFKTARKGVRHDVATFAIKMSMFWLALTILAGMLLAANRYWLFIRLSPLSLMHAHAHLGIVGIFITLLVGVSYKLVPMFAVTEIQSSQRAWWSLWLISAGLPVLIAGMVAGLGFVRIPGALLIVAGLITNTVEIRAMLLARKRKQLDWGIRLFMTSIYLIPVASGCGLFLALNPTGNYGRLETLYALLGLFGVVAFSLLAMMHKILPFLVWMRVYGSQIGRGKVPTIAALVSVPLQQSSYWAFLLSLALFCCAALAGSTTVARAGAGFLAAGLFLYLLNVALVTRHLFRPDSLIVNNPTTSKTSLA